MITTITMIVTITITITILLPCLRPLSRDSPCHAICHAFLRACVCTCLYGCRGLYIYIYIYIYTHNTCIIHKLIKINIAEDMRIYRAARRQFRQQLARIERASGPRVDKLYHNIT